MKTRQKLILTIIAIPIFHLPASISFSYDFAGGTGEPNDPYKIATAEQLISIGDDPNLLDKSFILINDIDLDPNLPEGRVFDRAVIWESSGVFDGNDHTIRNLTIEITDMRGSEDIGLFGYVHSHASIKNLRLEDVSIRGGSGVGGLVGKCSGALIACRATGYVQGDKHVGLMAGYCHGIAQDCSVAGIVHGQQQVGGLVGFCTGTITGCEASGEVHGIESVGGLIGITRSSNDVSRCRSTAVVFGQHAVGGLLGRNGGYVRYCYADAVVSGEDRVGGLVGENGYTLGDLGFSGVVACCYALGRVSGLEKVGGLAGVLQYQSQIHESYAVSQVSGDKHAGGLVGFAWQDPDPDSGVFRSFWDLEVSQTDSSGGGFGRTTTQMFDPNTFIEAGWDFVGPVDGPADRWAQSQANGYPSLWWQITPWPALPAFAGGTGTGSDPYLVSTAEQLDSIGDNPRLMDVHFTVVQDISLDRRLFHPIGSRLSPFIGSFDGRGHQILDMRIRRDDSLEAGLMGRVDGYASTVQNVVLVRPQVEAPDSDGVGALVGYMVYGTISECIVVDAYVQGAERVGGLVGRHNGTLSNCQVGGVISGERYVGGIAGTSSGSTEMCMTSCTTSGDSSVGGLAGRHDGEIFRSYSTGITSGTLSVGGLVGFCTGDLLACFVAGTVGGTRQVGGLVGYSYSTGVIERCYTYGTVTGDTELGGIVGASHCSVTNSYSTMIVSGDNTIGGLIGYNWNTVAWCYFSGQVSGNSVVGGLIGRSKSVSDTDSCFWDVISSGTNDGVASQTPDPAGAFAATPAEMQDPNTYLDAGWDFDTIWSICEGKDYPRLQWEGIECE